MTRSQTSWTLELIRDGGTVIRPEVLDLPELGPEWSPSINSLPGADIPVIDADVWLTDAVDNLDARLYYEGDRLPIDTLVGAERIQAAGRAETELELRGGTPLTERIGVEVASKNAHEVVADIGAQLPIPFVVDTPNLPGTDGRILQQASAANELSTVFAPAADTPFFVDGGTDTLRPRQTAWVGTPTDDFSFAGNGGTTITDADAEQDTAASLTDVAHEISLTLGPPDHDIPQSNLRVAVRARLDSVSFDTPSEAFLDIDFSGTTQASVDLQNAYGSSYAWADVDASTSQSTGTSFTLDASVRDAADSGSFSSALGVVIDGIAVYDDRAVHTFDGSPDPYFAGPGPFGVVRAEGTTALSEEGLARLIGEVTLSGGDATNLELGVSADGGQTYTTVSGQTSVDDTLGSSTDRATLRVGLSGTGTQASSPSDDVDPHKVEQTTLSADTTGTPRLLNESFDDDAVAVLRRIAERTGAIWEVQWNDSQSRQELHWTWPGQRPAADVDLASRTQIVRDSSTILKAATIKGGRRRRTVETDSAQFGALFRVTIEGTNEPVDEGDTLDVDARIQNIGNKDGSTDITLDVAGSQRDSQTGLSVPSNGETTVTLSWSTSAGDAGDYTATVTVADDSDSEAVAVVEDGFFDVSIQAVAQDTPTITNPSNATFTITNVSDNDPINGGQTYTATVTVENTGSLEGLAQATLDIDGTEEDSAFLQLLPGESTTVTLEWSTTTGDAGVRQADIQTPDDSVVRGVTVRATLSHEWLHDEGGGGPQDTGTASTALDGTLNGPSWASGSGSSNVYLDYNRSNQEYTTLPDAARSELSHWVNSGTGTLFAWVKPLQETNSNGNSLVIFASAVTASGFSKSLRLRANGEFIANSSNGQIIDLGWSFNIGSWQSVAIRADGTNAVAYRGDPNGSLTQVDTYSVQSGNTESGDIDVRLQWGIDRGSETTPPNGQIDGNNQDQWYDGGIDRFLTDSGDIGETALKNLHDQTKADYQ